MWRQLHEQFYAWKLYCTSWVGRENAEADRQTGMLTAQGFKQAFTYR